MSGGSARYWNEDTQSWEDVGSGGGAGVPVTPPPPPMPGFSPTEVVRPDASAYEVPPDAGPDGAGWWQPPPAGSAEAPTVTGWPGGVPGPSAAAVADVDARRRRLLFAGLGGAGVVAVAVALVLTLVVDNGDDDGKASRATAAGVSTASVVSSEPVEQPSESASESASSPSASVSVAAQPPLGYEVFEDGEGFRIALPEGWTRTTADSQYGIRVVNYRSSDSTHRIQVYQVQEPSPRASFELFLSDATGKAAGFTELGLETLDDGTFTGSRLEYLADAIRGEPEVGRWHVYDERFVASDSNIYAIAAYGPDADGRDDELELLTVALEWFCPPLGACEPGQPGESGQPGQSGRLGTGTGAIPQDSTAGTPSIR
ncbi:hypothetical protein [Streptomyces geranii]|uniref:hypothetical protein n=1 Tax=Streptomyces geranii TaxID=2058923 RepID=UPI0018E52EB3|nr:hypothetical protein [Streptomyces geranii]